MNSVLSLDHVGFVGTDLTKMAAAMRRLGFAPTAPETLLGREAGTGKIVSLQQQSCHVVLPNGYLELTAVATDDPAHHLAAWRSRGSSAHILALGTDDPEALHAQCVAAGLQPTALARATRPIDYGVMRGMAEFDWFMLPASVFAPVLLCVVCNRRPELVYQREVMAHPIGVEALEEVAIVVRQPDELFVRQLRWLGDASSAGANGLFIPLGRGGLTLTTPQAAAQRWGEDFDGPCWQAGGLAAVTLRVTDIAASERYLRSAGVALTRTAEEIRIASRDAAGTLLLLRG